MDIRIIGLPIAIICLFLIKRKWLAFIVSFAITAFVIMSSQGQFKSGPDVRYNWSALPEILAPILGSFVVYYAVAFIVFYVSRQFVLWVKNEPEVKSEQELKTIEQDKKAGDFLLTTLGLLAIIAFIGLLVWKVFSAM